MTTSSPLRSLVTAAASALVSAGICFAAAYGPYRKLADEIEMRPRVLIVNMGDIAQAVTAATPEAVDRAMAEARRNIERLVAAGWIVLDGQAVLGAPDDAFMRVRLQPPTEARGAGR